jgi:hypothetical protein
LIRLIGTAGIREEIFVAVNPPPYKLAEQHRFIIKPVAPSSHGAA